MTKTEATAGTPKSIPSQHASATSRVPKQAVVVIHGIGEQMPMDTIKDFVRAVWETDTDIHDKRYPDAGEVWSKPDVRTGSLELRRVTTRESIRSHGFPNGVRSDFYELYWADLSAGTTWDQIKDWIVVLLWRDPCKRVPHSLRSAWILLWLTVILVGYVALTLAFRTQSYESFNPLEWPPFSWIARVPTLLLAITMAVLGWLTNHVVVPYVGRIVRYTRAKPENIAARKDIRERGLALLQELHGGEYERIILVGHSLGSIVAYDLVNYFWASQLQARTIREKSREFAALCRLEKAVAEFEMAQGVPEIESKCDAFDAARRELGELLRARPRLRGGKQDGRWLITDLITLGSPLAHAEFLLAGDRVDLNLRKSRREFPLAPPIREALTTEVQDQAKKAGLPLDATAPKLLCFPLGNSGSWQLHHAAPFAAVRWTNIHDPASFIYSGDIVSGPLAPVFGPGIRDINLKTVRGRARCFTHTQYWDLPAAATQPALPQVTQLRDALDLAGRRLGLEDVPEPPLASFGVKPGDDCVLVWDIETIGDEQLESRLPIVPPKGAVDGQASSKPFRKLPLHKIVCIGTLLAVRTADGWQVANTAISYLGEAKPGGGEKSEKDLIVDFLASVAFLSPKFVTFNGATFDLPVLRYRAMSHGLSAGPLHVRDYFGRSDDMVDLCAALTGADSRDRVGLDLLAKSIGLPGKTDEMDGAKVEAKFKEGKTVEIAEYCERDVVQTYRAWLSYELFRERISAESFHLSEKNLREFTVKKPHLANLGT